MNTELRADLVAGSTAHWKAYWQLTKPRVVLLIIFTAVVGMIVTLPVGEFPIVQIIAATIGITFAAAAGAVINQIFDRDRDMLMTRTKARPLVQKVIPTNHAAIFAFSLTIASLIILLHWTNPLTAVLTMASMVGYAIVYTLYLKFATPQNIVIGGLAGAMPPILGSVAISGEVSNLAMLLTLIIFCWTPPHFWALAIHRARDYSVAGVPMLPITHGVTFTRQQIVLYTLLLIAVSSLPFAMQMVGLIYFLGVSLLNSIFLYYVWRLYRARETQFARETFIYSIQYLALLFALLLVDHFSNVIR